MRGPRDGASSAIQRRARRNAGSAQDHIANQLNTQELRRLTGG
jgi:hypothetical protein